MSTRPNSNPQRLKKAAENLRNPRLYASAMHDLAQADDKGARATLDAVLAARTDDGQARACDAQLGRL